LLCPDADGIVRAGDVPLPPKAFHARKSLFGIVAGELPAGRNVPKSRKAQSGFDKEVWRHSSDARHAFNRDTSIEGATEYLDETVTLVQRLR